MYYLNSAFLSYSQEETEVEGKERPGHSDDQEEGGEGYHGMYTQVACK